MEKGKQLFVILALFLLIVSISFASAITGKIGNGRMVLYHDVGESVEKSIRVINDNDVPLEISVFASGDLEEDIEILDTGFVLQPGEEKNARFKVKLEEEGKFENRINIEFSPLEENKSGVGLASQVIIYVGQGDGPGSDEDDSEDDEDSEDESVLGGITGNLISDSDNPNAIYIALGLSTLVLFAALLVLLHYSKKVIQKRKRGNGGESKKIKKEVVDK